MLSTPTINATKLVVGFIFKIRALDYCSSLMGFYLKCYLYQLEGLLLEFRKEGSKVAEFFYLGITDYLSLNFDVDTKIFPYYSHR